MQPKPILAQHLWRHGCIDTLARCINLPITWMVTRIWTYLFNGYSKGGMASK